MEDITVITTIINIIAAVLIAARVLYFQRYIKIVGSKRNNQYTTIIAICIESAALIILFSILFVVLVQIGSPVSFIFQQSLVHINVCVYNLLLGCKNRQSYVYKILGHIAASDYLSGGSRKRFSVLIKTTGRRTCSIGVGLCIDKKY